MLKVGLIRTTARRVAIGMAGTGTAGAAALTAYAHTEHGLGFRREVHFWSSVAPVVWDYWWNSFASSPKVKAQATAAEWRHRRKSAQSAETTTAEGAAAAAEEAWEEEQRARKKETMRQLHERNAPKIYDVMLALGGLYVKLGQVLSVTALPIPEEYRDYFRTLQSDVPASDFDAVVRPALERELGAPLEAAFESIDATPCGAASIGQAHRATLKGTREDVIVKVQYPEAKWQVPADIECVGQFLQLCVWFGAVDETAFRLSYDEFSRQFLAELDYEREKENLQAVYASSLDPRAPYLKRGVVVPRAFDDMCTKQVITMTYLPGPKFEEEAKAQLALLGIDTKRGVQSVVKETHGYTTSSASSDSDSAVGDEQALSLENTSTWKLTLSRIVGNFVSIDSVFSIVRFGRRIMLWSTAATVKSIRAASILPVVPSSWITWAEERQNTILQAERWGWTQEAVSTLLDVHGYQVSMCIPLSAYSKLNFQAQLTFPETQCIYCVRFSIRDCLVSRAFLIPSPLIHRAKS